MSDLTGKFRACVPARTATSGKGLMLLWTVFVLSTVAGCWQEMANQPRVEAYERSDFFPDGMAMRPPIQGTIARGELVSDAALTTGRSDGEPVTESPVPVDASVRKRGRERFLIFCQHCHGTSGAGDGIVVKRGFPTPPPLNSERLRMAPDGRLFQVITSGYGRMPGFGRRITSVDRWAIVASVRELQQKHREPVVEQEPRTREK